MKKTVRRCLWREWMSVLEILSLKWLEATWKEMCIKHLKIEDTEPVWVQGWGEKRVSHNCLSSFYCFFHSSWFILLYSNAVVLFVLIINLIYLDDSFLLGCHELFKLIFSRWQINDYKATACHSFITLDTFIYCCELSTLRWTFRRYSWCSGIINGRKLEFGSPSAKEQRFSLKL